MKVKRKFLIIIILCSVAVAGYLFMRFAEKQRADADGETKTVSLPKIRQQAMFYEENNFFAAIEKAKNIKPKENVFAIVVPHHLLASEYIAGMIKLSSGRAIERVIIIGPNHENVSQKILVSATAEWQTPFGGVKSDNSITDSFFERFGERSYSQVFDNEHSVGAIVPFVKYYFPKATITPVVINSYANLQDAKKLADWLDESLEEKTLLIVSTDFSHYLDKISAERNDLRTRKWIEERDVEAVSRLNNDFIDSPISLATVLVLAEKRNWVAKEIYHGNSFDFSLTKTSETTSYFGLAFSKE